MTKLPTHHQLWSRASNSTRASILVRSRSAAARTHTQDTHSLRHARDFRTGGAGSVGRDRGSRRGSMEEEATTTPTTTTTTTTLAIRQVGEAATRVESEGLVTQPYLPTTAASSSLSTSPTAAAATSASASGSYHSSSEATPVVYGPLTAEDALLASGTRTHTFAQASVDLPPSAAAHYVPRTMPASLTMTSRGQPARQLRTLWSSSTTTSSSTSSSNASASTSHMLVGPTNSWTPATATAPFSTIASLRAAASLLNSPYWPGLGVGSSHTSAVQGSTGTVTELDSDGVELDDQVRASTSASTLSGPTGSPSTTSLTHSPPFRWEEMLKAGISWTQSGAGGHEEVKASSSTAVDADVLASLAASIDTLLHLSTLAPASRYQQDENLTATGSSERRFTTDFAATEHLGQGQRNSRAEGSSYGSSSSSSGWQSARPPSPSYQASSGRNSPFFAPVPATSSVANNVTSGNQISSTTAPPNHASLTPISTSPPLVAASPHPLLSVDPFSGVEARRSLTYSHHASDTPSAVPVFEFHHGAYGIPKRHPLAAAPSPRGGRGSSGTSSGGSSSAPLKGTRSMLAAAADFLAGPQTPPPPPPPKAQAAASKSSSKWKKLDPATMRSVQVGEDSYFLRPDSIGIADGVGGWATRPGANPAMFSRLLMHFCSVELSRFDWVVDDPSGQGGSGDKKKRNDDSAASLGSKALYNEGESPGIALERHEHLDPVEVMHRAWERCVRVARREGILGSTTALLALLRNDELRIANLGDCVLLIVRKGELLFRSQEQQHSFNFPVQLGMMVRRGTRDVEDLVEGLSKAGGKDTSKVGWTTASPSSSRDPEGQDEDYNSPEAEALVQEYTRRLDVISQRAAGLSQQAESEAKAKEREGLKRRALFEGKSEEEFEAEMKAGEEYDFDVNTGSSKSGPNDQQKAAEDEEEEDEEDRSTVYVGFDDAHPWDEPRRDCGRWTIKVQKGDIIIVASDGLVDNLFDDDIIEEVQRFAPPPSTPHMDGQGDECDDHHHHYGRYDEHEDGHSTSGYSRTDSGISLPDSENVPPSSSSAPPYPPRDFSPQLLSEALASRAKAISQDSKAIVSPFQQRATEEGLHYVGGKHDDISVLVAVVGEAGGGAGAGDSGGAEGEGVEGGGGLELRAR